MRNLIDAGLARRRFDAVDQRADLLFEIVEGDQQFRLQHDEQVAVVLVRVERRAGEHTQGLNDKCEAEALIAAEREQRPEPRHGRVAGRPPFGIDRDPFGEQLT